MSSVIKYRPEIDGLRAIAVVSVMLFHMCASWLPGGFVGVDVFFVLSGFLITSIMLKEHLNGCFTYSEFYVRRIKRILPPLYVVLFVSSVAGFFLLLGPDFHYFKESLDKVLTFLSNEYFMKVGDYFAPKTNEMPLLHTWSLAVEEQFYFVWPTLFLLSWKIPKRFRLGAYILGAVFSFVIAEVLIYQGHLAKSYYSLVSRGGELLIGAILAIVLIESSVGRPGKKIAEVLAWFGIALIVGSFFLISEKSSFPGVNSLYSTVGTALVIFATSFEVIFVQRILSHRVFVHLGKLSYSLYLWHWPVLAYMRYVLGGYSLSLPWLIVMASLTYLLSYLSYTFVENPIRKVKFNFRNAFVFACLIPAVILSVFASIADSNDILSFRQDVALDRKSYGGKEICHGRISRDCIRGANTAPSILVFGDSHAAHYNYFVDEIGKQLNWSALVLSASSCGPVFGFDLNVLPQWAQKPCGDLLNFVEISSSSYKAIIISSRWDFQFGLSPGDKSDANFGQKLEATLRKLSAHKVPVFVLSQIPLLDKNPYRFARAHQFGIPIGLDFKETFAEANEMAKTVVGRVPNVHWVDTASLIDQKRLADEIVLYMDNNHLSISGSKILAKRYLQNPSEFSIISQKSQ